MVIMYMLITLIGSRFQAQLLKTLILRKAMVLLCTSC